MKRFKFTYNRRFVGVINAPTEADAMSQAIQQGRRFSPYAPVEQVQAWCAISTWAL